MKKNRADSKRVQTKGVLVRWLCNSSINYTKNNMAAKRQGLYRLFFFGGEGTGKGRGREEFYNYIEVLLFHFTLFINFTFIIWRRRFVPFEIFY